VQKGKLAASALALATTALNKVDFPTLGSPTIPALSIFDLRFCEVQSQFKQVQVWFGALYQKGFEEWALVLVLVLVWELVVPVQR
jgi:hypothetical protein